MQPYIVPIIFQIAGIAVVLAEVLLPSGGLLAVIAAGCLGYSLYLAFTTISTNAVEGNCETAPKATRPSRSIRFSLFLGAMRFSRAKCSPFQSSSLNAGDGRSLVLCFAYHAKPNAVNPVVGVIG